MVGDGVKPLSPEEESRLAEMVRDLPPGGPARKSGVSAIIGEFPLERIEASSDSHRATSDAAGAARKLIAKHGIDTILEEWEWARLGRNRQQHGDGPGRE